MTTSRGSARGRGRWTKKSKFLEEKLRRILEVVSCEFCHCEWWKEWFESSMEVCCHVHSSVDVSFDVSFSCSCVFDVVQKNRFQKWLKKITCKLQIILMCCENCFWIFVEFVFIFEWFVAWIKCMWSCYKNERDVVIRIFCDFDCARDIDVRVKILNLMSF